MKKLFLLLFTIFTLSVYSQDRISVGLFQDGKLLVSDDTHGNTAPTADLLLSFDLQGKQFSTYYFSVKPQLEYADLDSGRLIRYSVNTMWNFNTLDIDNVQLSIGAGIGVIHKNGEGTPTYSILSELTYPFSDRWRVGIKNELVRRSELKTSVLRYNLSFGVVYDIIRL